MSRKAILILFASCVALLTPMLAGAQEKLEMFSWWTGDHDAGLQALVQRYNSLYPDVAVTNATAALSPEADARSVLRTRMLVGDPPDTFQVRGGRDLIDTWVAANRIEDLMGFYKAQGWNGIFPRELVSLLSTKTGIWSLPLAINRSNVMWYVPARLTSWGVYPPRTLGELFATCQKLRNKGVAAPLAVGDTATLIDLWESITIATLGPDDWDAVWAGRIRFTDPRMVRVWENFERALEFTEPDAAGLSWEQTLDKVVKGESAFAFVGDWAESYLAKNLKLTPGEGFAWVPAPGTNGIFVARADSFCLPKGFKDTASIFKWLMMLGTREAQDVFNATNGSISPRRDSETESYDAYFRSAARDWKESRIVGSMAHGMVAPEAFVRQFADVIHIAVTTKDAREAASAAQAIADMTHLVK
ncbi:MAG TPA: ABC transporter substrate-binding protein [Spirochaetia bacterium]|nr:ABC transporter substrate-binding protein [Spirochaetia bacterium]